MLVAMIVETPNIFAEVSLKSEADIGETGWGAFTLRLGGELVSDTEMLVPIGNISQGMERSLKWTGRREIPLKLANLDWADRWVYMNAVVCGQEDCRGQFLHLHNGEAFYIFWPWEECFFDFTFFLIESNSFGEERIIWNSSKGTKAEVRQVTLNLGEYNYFALQFIRQIRRER